MLWHRGEWADFSEWYRARTDKRCLDSTLRLLLIKWQTRTAWTRLTLCCNETAEETCVDFAEWYRARTDGRCLDSTLRLPQDQKMTEKNSWLPQDQKMTEKNSWTRLCCNETAEETCVDSAEWYRARTDGRCLDSTLRLPQDQKMTDKNSWTIQTDSVKAQRRRVLLVV